MDLKKTVFLFYIGFSVVGTSVVDFIQQCELKDTSCQLTTFNIILRNIARFGAPEYGIPVLDPFEIVDTEVSIRNILNITMPEGEIYGLKYCMFQHYEMNSDNKGQLEVTCTLSIMGQYRFTAEGHLLEHLFGEYSLHGDGDVQIIMEQIHVTLYVLRRPIRRQDGKIYLTYKFEHMYDVFGKSSFYADNIYSGEKNVTKKVLDMINKNWRVVMDLLGNEIVEKAVDYFRLYTNLIHDSIPADVFIKDDLKQSVDRSHNTIPREPKELTQGLPAIAQFIIYLALLRG